MPLPERGGNCESMVALLRSVWLVKGFPECAVEKFAFELRELGRKPPRKDMSGSELKDKV